MFYVGNWFDSYKNGFGYLLFDNGLVYKGEFKDDQKVNGVIINFQNMKIIYEGGWANDLFSGLGRLDRQNGQSYQGEFSKGMFNG